MGRVESYAAYLTLQAEISFGQEVSLFYTPQFLDAHTVVEAGCGNAAFLSLLAQAFPQKRFIGIDNDDAMLSQSPPSLPRNIELRQADLTADPRDVPEGSFVVSRLVSIYLPKPDVLARWAARFASASVVIEPVDSLFALHPPIQEFLESEDSNTLRIANEGGSRSVVDQIEDCWIAEGFGLISKRDILVQNTVPGNRHLFAHMMALHSELASGRPATDTLLRSLYDWQNIPQAYVQYGLRAFQFSGPATQGVQA